MYEVNMLVIVARQSANTVREQDKCATTPALSFSCQIGWGNRIGLNLQELRTVNKQNKIYMTAPRPSVRN